MFADLQPTLVFDYFKLTLVLTPLEWFVVLLYLIFKVIVNIFVLIILMCLCSDFLFMIVKILFEGLLCLETRIARTSASALVALLLSSCLSATSSA